MDPLQVILLFASIGIAAFALVKSRLGDSALKRLLLLLSVLFVGGSVALGLFDLDRLSKATKENHFVEWFTDANLLSAACIAWLATIWAHRRGEPSPAAATLATGFTWAVLRELEYGGNLVGKQFFFTRNVFRLDAYTQVSHFEAFKEKMNLPYDAGALYAIHICCTALAFVFLLALAWYVFRNPGRTFAELRNIPRVLYGRLSLMGVGLYIAAEIVGGALHRMHRWGMVDSWTNSRGKILHRIAEETIECWGSIAILFCAIALGQAARRLPEKTPRT